jgi:hypothetical protein
MDVPAAIIKIAKGTVARSAIRRSINIVSVATLGIIITNLMCRRRIHISHIHNRLIHRIGFHIIRGAGTIGRRRRITSYAVYVARRLKRNCRTKRNDYYVQYRTSGKMAMAKRCPGRTDGWNL